MLSRAEGEGEGAADAGGGVGAVDDAAGVRLAGAEVSGSVGNADAR